MQNLPGKSAFITGGASGIGLGMARAFGAAGMKVVIADIRQDHLDAAAALCREDGAEAHTILLDVTDRAAMAQAADDAERVFGKVHVLCNNAGIGIGGNMKLATYDDWDWVMSVNVGGVINGIQTFVPRILAHGEGGHIVNTASMSGIFSSGQAGLYITSKFAIVGLSEALRTDLAADNIGVSAFCPGPVRSNIAESGKTRPQQYATTGYTEADKARRARSVDRRHLYMDPLEVGNRVLAGIQHNDLYIFTHPEFRQGIQERCAALLAALPLEEPDPERVAAIDFLLSNPIYKTNREPA